MSNVNAFLGEIRIVGFNFPPEGWADCNGQLLSIENHDALFSLLGTNYGGDGRTTFGLPDYRGRVPIHQGQGPGLPNYYQGQKGGSDTPIEVQTKTGGEAVVSKSPYLVSRFIICLDGTFPPRQ